MHKALLINTKKLWKYILNLSGMLIVSVFLGLFGGVIGSAFHICIDIVTDGRADHPQILYLMPVGGIVIVVLYKLFASKNKVNTDLVISSIREDKKIPFVMMPLIFVSTVITQLVGGSAGREGAALQLGGSLGYNFGRLLGVNLKKSRVLVMSGMSAVFSALFGTPVTAALFSLEVASVGLMDYTAFLPCVISAVTARFVASAMGVLPVSFEGIVFDVNLVMILRVSVLAALCAVLSIVFCITVKKGTKLIEKILPNPYIRMVALSLVLIAATLVLGTYDYNGAGMNIVERAMRGEAFPLAFALKLAFTAVSLAAGFKGGEIVPAFFVGSTFGCAVAPLLGISPEVGAAIGFVSLFCGIVNCPVASIVLSVEVFGASGLLLFAVSCGISYMLSGSYSLYGSQEFVYSKYDGSYKK